MSTWKVVSRTGLALVADAGHMLADAAALALAIAAQKIAAQARTRTRTYGFRRADNQVCFYGEMEKFLGKHIGAKQ